MNYGGKKPRFRRWTVFAKNLGFGVGFGYRNNTSLPLFAICATLVRILLSLVVAGLPYCYAGSDAINFTSTEPFRSRANSLPGANRPIGLWPFRSLANSLPGPFVP